MKLYQLTVDHVLAMRAAYKDFFNVPVGETKETGFGEHGEIKAAYNVNGFSFMGANDAHYLGTKLNAGDLVAALHHFDLIER
jgi:hypothetical protein